MPPTRPPYPPELKELRKHLRAQNKERRQENDSS